MNAAVTGGTGFVGQALIRLLAPVADEIRVMVRQPQDDDRIRALGGSPIRGDLTMEGGSDGLVRQGDVVFHCAARVNLSGTWTEFRETTIEGTRRLLDAALPRKPARFVYVSSAGVYPLPNGRPACADHTPARPISYNLYGRAKIQAEKLVRRRCHQAGCPWVIVRLGFLYGPQNDALYRHFHTIANRYGLSIIGNGLNRIATLYIDDAIQALLLAGTHPHAVNKVYDAANDEPVSQESFLCAVSEAIGLPPPRHHLKPEIIAHFLACIADCLARITGDDFQITRSMIALMAADQAIDSSLIKRDLGWTTRVTFEQGMRYTREWYQQTRP